MEQNPNFYIIFGSFAALTVGIVSSLGLRGWRDWIALKHAELDITRRASDTPVPSATSLIEVADLKERVKRLEAIAAGIDI
jgi:hypothetical protein